MRSQATRTNTRKEHLEEILGCLLSLALFLCMISSIYVIPWQNFIK